MIQINDLTEFFKEEMECHGADLIGIGDLSEIPSELRCNMPFGIAIAVAYDPEIIRGISEMPTKEYYAAYNKINDELDMLVDLGADFLRMDRSIALPQRRSVIVEDYNSWSTVLPHKTVATRAGLGWIGKDALLVTEKYGSAVRISTILTNAPLQADKPINKSKCGECSRCVTACPAEAMTGINWSIKSSREELYNAAQCRKTARKRAYASFGIEITLCGKCINVCPYTQKYINSAD